MVNYIELEDLEEVRRKEEEKRQREEEEALREFMRYQEKESRKSGRCTIL